MSTIDFQKKLSSGEMTALADPTSGIPVTKLSVGVMWDASNRGKKGLLGRLNRKVGVDLDLMAVALDAQGKGLRICGPDNLHIFGGAAKHSGDNRTGLGDGIDESIVVDLTGMRSDVEALVFVVTAYKKGVSFSQAQNVDCYLFDESTGSQQELTIFSPPVDTADNTVLFALVDRQGAGWGVTIINETVNTTADGLVAEVGKLFRASS